MLVSKLKLVTISFCSIISCLADDSYLLTKFDKKSQDNESNPVLDDFYHYAELFGISTCYITSNSHTLADTDILIPNNCTAGYFHDSEFDQLSFADAQWPNIVNGSEDNSTYMMGIYDHKRKENVFVFVGSETSNNFKLDYTNASLTYEPLIKKKNSILPSISKNDTTNTCSDCKIHSGFYITWEANYEFSFKTIKKMIEKHPDYKLVVIGHSLGAVTAQYAGLELYLLGYNPLIVNWGSPPLGDKNFVKYLNEVTKVEETFDSFGPLSSMTGNIRYHHKNDFAIVLFNETYSHGGVEVYIAKHGDYPSAKEIAICDPTSSDCGGYYNALIVANTTNVAGNPIEHMVYFVYLDPSGDLMEFLKTIPEAAAIMPKTSSTSNSSITGNTTLTRTGFVSTQRTVVTGRTSNTNVNSGRGTSSGFPSETGAAAVTQKNDGYIYKNNSIIAALFSLISLLI